MASNPAPTGAPASDGTSQDRAFLGQPRALSTLFFTEMWERFSYYGMRALLILYLTAPLVAEPGQQSGLGIDNGTAIAIYGAYSGLVYLTPIAGGWIADRLIGARRAVLFGGIIIAAGHYLMALPAELSFWIGLLCIAVGTGALKPNISAMVGDLYDERDARRDAGFSLFYMGINIGSFAAPLITGFFADQGGYHWGFGIAGVGMTLAVIQYVAGWKNFRDVGSRPHDPATPAQRNKFLLGILCSVVAIVVITFLLGLVDDASLADHTATAITLFILAMPVIYFYQLFRRKDYSERERQHVRAFIWVFLAAASFWMVFEQSGSTLNLFANNVTDLSVLSIGSWTMPASWLQSVNPLFIVIFAPIFAAFWTRLGNRAPRTSVKFAIGLTGVGISIIILAIPMSAYQADPARKAAIFWLLSTYLLQTWSELFLSPTGLAASSKLAPAGASGQLLALWFLATSVGVSVGGQIGKFTAGNPVNTFIVLGTIAVVVAVVTIVIRKWINKAMEPVH